MGLSRTGSDIDGDFSRKLLNFPPPYILPLYNGVPHRTGVGGGVRKNQNDGATSRSLKFQDRFSHLDTIPACDIHPVIQPRCHSNSRAMLRVVGAIR